MSKHEDSFTQLYIDQLRDLYSAEKQLTKALPKMAKAASSANLKQAFQDHLEETNEQMERLKLIFNALGQKPEGKKCAAMEGLIKEGKEVIDEDDFGPEVTDAGLIAAAQRVEHYEMSAYGTAICFSELLGFEDAATLLEKSSKEEIAADKKLNELALNEVNQRALDSDEEAYDANARRPVNRNTRSGHVERHT